MQKKSNLTDVFTFAVLLFLQEYIQKSKKSKLANVCTFTVLSFPTFMPVFTHNCLKLHAQGVLSFLGFSYLLSNIFVP